MHQLLFQPENNPGLTISQNCLADFTSRERRFEQAAQEAKLLHNGHSKTPVERKRSEPREIIPAPAQRPAKLPLSA